MVGLLFAVTSLTLATARASEQTSDSYAGVLDGASVVPPVPFPPQAASGRADFFLSASNELSYQMYDCTGLSNVEAHIHGPAPAGAIGPVIFTIPAGSSQSWYRTGVIGVLNDQQLRDLNCGLWYIDIHTAEYPFGQVRGQIRGLWGWQPASPCFLAASESTWGAVKTLYR
jgi:hypothetical protein